MAFVTFCCDLDPLVLLVELSREGDFMQLACSHDTGLSNDARRTVVGKDQSKVAIRPQLVSRD
jgi:hypothetical protein